MARAAVVLLLGGLGLSLAAATRPFADYQTVIDRQMFGAPPKGFDPSKMPSDVAKANSKAEQEKSKAEEKIRRAIRFSVLNVTADGEVMVGFTDQRDAKNPLNYYMKVGETRNGWTVKDADRTEATMTIVDEEGIEVSLRLGGDSASDPQSVKALAENKAVSNANAAAPTTAGAPRLLSMRARRMAKEREREAQDAREKKDFAALREDLQLMRANLLEERAAREAAAQKAAESAAPEDRGDMPPPPPGPDGDEEDGH